MAKALITYDTYLGRFMEEVPIEQVDEFIRDLTTHSIDNYFVEYPDRQTPVHDVKHHLRPVR
jgi:2,3-bisphosphoglycerate-independent phosphoglycerate mutase